MPVGFSVENFLDEQQKFSQQQERPSMDDDDGNNGSPTAIEQCSSRFLNLENKKNVDYS